MSKISNELKNICETTVDELFDKVQSGGMSNADAMVALAGSFKDIPGGIFSLKKESLKRSFMLIGHENEFPVGSGKEVVNAARVLLSTLLFRDEISGSDNDSGVSDALHDDTTHDSDDEQEKAGDLDNIQRSSGVTLTSPRGSPRKSVQLSKIERVKNHDADRIQHLENLVQTLIKNTDERKQTEETKLLNALQSLPTIDKKKKLETSKLSSGSKVKMSKRGATGRKNVKYAVPDAYSNDSSSSTSDSDSSSLNSSSSTSSSSDHVSRRRRSKHSKHHSGTCTQERHAKSFIVNCGREGIFTYVDRIKTQLVISKGSLSEADIRSMHEAESIAHALDAFIGDGVSSKSDGIEILSTRLIGLICAVQTGDWSVMAAIQYKKIGTNTLPLSSKQIAKLVKQGTRIKTLTTVATKSKGNTNRKGFASNTGQSDGAPAGTGFGSKQKFTDGSGTNTSANKSTNVGATQDKSSSKSQ